MEDLTPLHRARLSYRPPLPTVLQGATLLERGEASHALAHADELRERFSHVFGAPHVTLRPGDGETRPLRLGVVLSGGQAPGGHNVIAGLFDGLPPGSELLGFIGGPSGIVGNEAQVLTAERIDQFRNLGGFDIIGSGRTKIETDEQLAASLNTVKERRLDGLVVIGGDDSNTNAALLANYFAAQDQATCVVGVPKTIDGDLKSKQIEISFGHDTACRVYAELIGNLMRDAASARKYYHFVKLMGRSASHIALECALQTRPNLCLIGEEVAAREQTLAGLTEEIADRICERADAGKHFGVVLVPEGLIEFLPEMGELIGELNEYLADPHHVEELERRPTILDKVHYLAWHLSDGPRHCLAAMPDAIAAQLLLDRDPHGNVQVSRIETERLLIETVGEELKRRKVKFGAVHHFFGYEGRSAMPTHFDCAYCAALGRVAVRLVAGGCSGYMARVANLTAPVADWVCGGVPLTAMMCLERRKGVEKPVIRKALVDLQGAPFQYFAGERERWAREDLYRYPGPIQFGAAELADQLPCTLELEHPS